MKKPVLLSAAIIGISVSSFSQTTKPATSKPATKPAVVTNPQPIFKNILDSASYAIGIFTVNSFKQYGITKINSAMVARAIDDLLNNKPQLLNDSTANACISGFISSLQTEKAKPAIDAGEKYLAENAKKPGVQKTASGLQYEVITMGTGPKPTIGDTVICNYRGTYIDGSIFDESYKTGKPATFAVNRVISGWTEALQLMPVGSKWKLYVPYKLAYGANDYYSIPGGSMLIFELELLGIQGK